MSKGNSKSKQRNVDHSGGMPGFQRGRVAEIIDSLKDSQILESDFSAEINASIMAFAQDAMRFALRDRRNALQSLDREQRLVFGGMIAYATQMGFAMALYRYADELKRVPELTAWHRKREAGINKGHATQSQARAAKYQRIRDTQARLEAAGEPCTYDAVAAACGCSRSTVERAINGRATKRTKP